MGQFVELYPTLADDRGGSIDAGTRGRVAQIDPTRHDEDHYLVEFLGIDMLHDGRRAWLRARDLFPA